MLQAILSSSINKRADLCLGGPSNAWSDLGQKSPNASRQRGCKRSNPCDCTVTPDPLSTFQGQRIETLRTRFTSA
ncbi:hypothetical protein SynA1560_02094 [Synechococcus sp. A15-60]|nr:hypothetical protein SynA1560_02094 [Synechococcus sp. A15-60]